MSSKTILVIGATGAQGIAVIKALLAPSPDGAKSPYSVRALTRDATNYRAKELSKLGVEVVQGSVTDLPSVAKAFEGVYGAFVNTDSFTLGESKEVFIGLKVYEIAKRTPSVRHYVWSSLDYASKKGNYDLQYHAAHYDGKARVTEFLKAQPSDTGADGFVWSAITTGPYMDMLNMHTLGPLNRRADGTVVFAVPVNNGHVPLITLEDLGWWARYSFDHRAAVSARDLEVASDLAAWPDVVAAFTRVTGEKAVFVRQTLAEWWRNFNNVDVAVAADLRGPGGKPVGDAPTIRENFSAFWSLYRDDIFTRDMAWIRSVHPGTKSVEDWMRETGYKGQLGNILKGYETGDRTAWSVNREVTATL